MENILDFTYVIIRWDQVLFCIQTLWLVIFSTWCGTTSMILSSNTVDPKSNAYDVSKQLKVFSVLGAVLLIVLWTEVPEAMQLSWQYVVLFGQTAITGLVCYICIKLD